MNVRPLAILLLPWAAQAGILEGLSSTGGGGSSIPASQSGGGAGAGSPAVALPLAVFASVAGVVSSRGDEEDDTPRRETPEPAAEQPPARSRGVEQILDEAARSAQPLTVLGVRPADTRETALSESARAQAQVVTARTVEGDAIHFITTRAHSFALAAPLSVRTVSSGYNVLAGERVVAFIPRSKLLELTGHAERAP